MTFLFVCTHNRCRSILCEAIANQVWEGRLRASSAGSQPAGRIHPATLAALRRRGISTEGLRSKSWDELQGEAPQVVITVCDSAAGEACPLWLGDSAKVHWGLADPSKLEGSEKEVAAAFDSLMDLIEFRARKILALNPHALAERELRASLIAMAEEEHGPV